MAVKKNSNKFYIIDPRPINNSSILGADNGYTSLACAEKDLKDNPEDFFGSDSYGPDEVVIVKRVEVARKCGIEFIDMTDC